MQIEKHTLGTAVELTSTNYEAPADGYVKIFVDQQASANVYLYINDSTAAFVYYVGFGYPINSIFVKKGMNLRVAASNGWGQYFPLE